ncbi:MAG: competence/damage-inducible protein A [Actinomycetota bacterium]|nr:competence/damage-inducible protein A [Actinomycetota bacterium]
MKCEVVAVGTELLLGQIVNTNSAWIGERLAEVGIDCHRHTVVGDNPARMLDTIREALERADAVVVTGGLGPTQDDLTREVIAEVMGVRLERDPDLVERIRSRFSSRGRNMPENNLRQADIPVGATAITELPGTAPGLLCPMGGGKVIYAVPGVPWEMQQMIEGTVLEDLQRRVGIGSVIRSRVLRTWGQSESGLAEDLADEIQRLDREGGPTLAFLASGIEGLRVRITAKAGDEDEVQALLDAEEQRVREAVGRYVFGLDEETMEAVVLKELTAQGLTLAVVESLTGGLIGARLTDVPGASRAFRGSVVAYDADVKRSLLEIPDGPAVGEAAVRAMAEAACRILGADVSLAVTGVAGPEPQDGQPPGTVWMATSVDGVVETLQVTFPADRAQVRQFTVITVLNLLRIRLLARRSS